MYKYLFQFTKTDYMKFISHLDLMSTFERAFRRADIKILYSQGFSPHPKLSIAHPLSVGISSTSEYMEVEIEERKEGLEILSRLNDVLPEGIRILNCKEMIEKKKSLAALVEYAAYDISFHIEDIEQDVLIKTIEDFLSEIEIIAIKKQMKTHTIKQVDIRPFIDAFELTKYSQGVATITAIIKTGSNGNLNPELLMQSFIESSEIKIDPNEIKIMRTELYFVKENKRIPFSSIN